MHGLTIADWRMSNVDGRLIIDNRHSTFDIRQLVLTIGNFDGVHRAHQQLLGPAIDEALSQADVTLSEIEAIAVAQIK